MKKLKKCLTVLLALLMALSSFAGEAQIPEDSGISRYTYSAESGDYGGVRVSFEYDERGLAKAMDVGLLGDTLHMDLVYTLDEQGNPESVSAQIMDESIQVILENRYEGGELTEAVITLFCMGEEIVSASDLQENPAAASTFLSGLLSFVLPALQYSAGYRNCSLSVAGIGTLLRNENGRQVYSLSPSAYSETETLTDYAEDGGVTLTQNTYRVDGGEKQLLLSSAYERDGSLILRRIEMRDPSGASACITFRLEVAGTNDDGEVQLRAVVDEVTVSGGTGNFSDLDPVSLRGREFELYTLDDEGRVIRSRQSMLVDPNMEDYYSEATTWYDPCGRVIRTEQLTRTASMEIRTVTETEYRP